MRRNRGKWLPGEIKTVDTTTNVKGRLLLVIASSFEQGHTIGWVGDVATIQTKTATRTYRW